MTEPGDIDRAALERAMSIASRDAFWAAHWRSRLDDGEPWIEVAESAAGHCQREALALKPWQEPPMEADEDNPDDRDPKARRLLIRMLAAGVSRFDPDPMKALKKKCRK
jgi:hypothetical protein